MIAAVAFAADELRLDTAALLADSTQVLRISTLPSTTSPTE
jgi:hypothetical protein